MKKYDFEFESRNRVSSADQDQGEGSGNHDNSNHDNGNHVNGNHVNGDGDIHGGSETERSPYLTAGRPSGKSISWYSHVSQLLQTFPFSYSCYNIKSVTN